MNINPSLDSPSLYNQNQQIPEHHRKAFTRMRLSSHRLKVETGRWARIPRHQRLCACERDIQSEEHVLLHYPRTAHLRDRLTFSNIKTMMDSAGEPFVASLCFNALKTFELWTINCELWLYRLIISVPPNSSFILVEMTIKNLSI